MGESEDRPFGSKHQIEGSVDDRVIDDFNKIFEEERKKATANDRSEPTRSAILEMLLRKGIKAYRGGV